MASIVSSVSSSIDTSISVNVRILPMFFLVNDGLTVKSDAADVSGSDHTSLL
jgi:hypothetical protein